VLESRKLSDFRLTTGAMEESIARAASQPPLARLHRAIECPSPSLTPTAPINRVRCETAW
jgi:hypothetical protein